MNVNGTGAIEKVTNQKQIATVKGLLNDINYKKRFDEILGKKAVGFMASIINVSNNQALAGVEPQSIISSAVVAATLDLPIDPNLGYAYLVPFNTKIGDKFVKKAQMIVGWRGFVQLAMRTGQYKTINATEVYEGEIKHVNRLTGEVELNNEEVASDKVIGYIAYFRLLNGYEKSLYMTIEQLEKHAKKYSQTYKSNKEWVVKSSKWTTDFDAMATKTVLKLLLSKYGMLSIEMQRAIEADQAVIKDNIMDKDFDSNSVDYVDNGANDVDFEEMKEEPEAKDEFAGTPFEVKEGKK